MELGLKLMKRDDLKKIRKEIMKKMIMTMIVIMVLINLIEVMCICVIYGVYKVK